MAQVDPVLKRLAERIVFDKLNISELPPEGYEYRKGKGPEHVRLAVKSALRQAPPKVEYEVEMVALGLSKVFKKTKTAS